MYDQPIPYSITGGVVTDKVMELDYMERLNALRRERELLERENIIVNERSSSKNNNSSPLKNRFY